MRLIAYQRGNEAQVGVLDRDNGCAELASRGEFWGDVDGWVERARSVTDFPLKTLDLTLLPLAPPSARVVCIGLNYKAHAEEAAMAVPERPAVIGRWPASLAAHGTPVPAVEDWMDWEGELAAVIGRSAARVTPERALDAVLGYACFNDISARTYQLHSPQWTLGKNSDATGPLGTLVTRDEAGDPVAGLDLTTRVNGRLVQQSSTSAMIRSVAEIVAYLSEALTLHPGDVIATGTPAGVGFSREPREALKVGDVVEVEIETLGILRNQMVGWNA
ncbi:fumarylacetoacetate hydrolase family protein [Sphingomonas crusticola]|uniref:fumarylacetoacetate hydrolase family protein n=1 Tax=Sphingomonas crusticola TaxID=1697973 RepID=UPI000E24D003|nr:fumarylacetoacetate hydrolase family protein [Sphingomonas crusticola]